jgi:Lipocalin-like domain
MCRSIGFLFAACLVAQPGFAADNDKIVGTWKLVSYEVEVQASGRTAPVMGVHPSGYVTFTPDGRVYVGLVKNSSTAL